MEGRFNHSMLVYCNKDNNKDYLFIYGGRNKESELISDFVCCLLTVVDGELVIKELFNSNHTNNHNTTANINTHHNTYISKPTQPTISNITNPHNTFNHYSHTSPTSPFNHLNYKMF